jgi:serine/threonine protein kinase
MRPSKKAPRVPVELDEICLKALAPERADRYGTCDEMRQALQAWLAQNAPTTDGSRMASFLLELFSDDIVREKTERQELIARVRTRALTLPPSDELRIMVERSDRVVPPRDDDENTNVDAPVRKPGSIGRRTEDRGDRDNDRRNQGDRRLGRSPLSASDGSGAAAAALAEAQPAETETDLIGVEVDGRYRVLELIGEGGMGKVYLAEHVEIGKRVALKVLHPSYSRMPDLVERFRREARAASKIGHPNIVDVTDSGTTAAGSVYFVMEYLEGVELGSVIEREGAINVERALKIATQICRALAAAHAQGIVHRDLKPENVFLITRDGAADVVKVLDFGIAKTTEAEAARERRLTSPGMAMGTPEYMAPEQAAGRPADARCDIYALVAIMYEMVTGLPPYSGDNFMEILTKKATIDPPPPLSIRSELPPQVSDLVMQSMARSPDSRPQTMEGLEYELNKCLAGRGIAVAQILGMTTDATLVANLNPGLSVRNLDSEGTVSRAPSSSAGIGLPRAGTNQELWETRSGVSMQMGSISTTGQMAAPRPTSEPTATALASSPNRAMSPAISQPAERLASQVSEGSISLAPKRGALGVFGWLLLAAILFGGVGALLYVALGERGERGEHPKVEGALTTGVGSNVASNVPPTVGSAVADQQHAVAPGAGSAVAGTVTHDLGSANNSVAPLPPIVNPPQTGHIKPGAKPPIDKTIKHPPVASTVADDTSAKALIDRGKALEKRNEWEQARGVYSKLEKVKGYGPESLYLQAYAAFGAHQLDDALQLSKKAAEQLTGQRKTDAQFLYGDALYRQAEFSRAKDIYMGLRKRLQGEQKTTAAKKVAACNKALHLPDNDGIDD